MSETGVKAANLVLIDTDVFSKVFVGSASNPQRQKWAAALAGRTVAIAVQTEMELRAWPLLRNWGAAKTDQLHAQIAALGTIQVTHAVQASFVTLTVWAKQSGHAIHDRAHTADRWIAATALAYDLELAAGDGIYDDVEDLRRYPSIP